MGVILGHVLGIWILRSIGLIIVTLSFYSQAVFCSMSVFTLEGDLKESERMYFKRHI